MLFLPTMASDFLSTNQNANYRNGYPMLISNNLSYVKLSMCAHFVEAFNFSVFGLGNEKPINRPILLDTNVCHFCYIKLN